MRNSPIWWILISFMVALDFYCFQAIKVVVHAASPKVRALVFIVYWVVSVSAIILLLVLPYLQFEHQAKLFRTTLFAVIAGIFFAKLLGSFFFLIDDLRRGTQWIANKFLNIRDAKTQLDAGAAISRSAFLSWTGTIMGSGLFGSLIYGFWNKYRYQLKKVQLSFQNLPEAFRGIRIVHISDIHSGSFTDKEAVKKGVEKIMKQRADLILFTGDLVNNVADEMQNYIDVFDKLSAPLGVYSILGNHDYGDYVEWANKAEKEANLERLKNIHGQLGWKLLMNEHVVLEKGNDKIAVVGIENWSDKARFPKYGNLEKAYAGADTYPFKILMSHDPSHWDAEVKKKYPGIDLMLSGHTHGMQFGVEIPGFRWSPVQYLYRQWAGLYEDQHQKLYINRGFGFIGYPGRVGILPEITVLELA